MHARAREKQMLLKKGFEKTINKIKQWPLNNVFLRIVDLVQNPTQIWIHKIGFWIIIITDTFLPFSLFWNLTHEEPQYSFRSTECFLLSMTSDAEFIQISEFNLILHCRKFWCTPFLKVRPVSESSLELVYHHWQWFSLLDSYFNMLYSRWLPDGGTAKTKIR